MRAPQVPPYQRRPLTLHRHGEAKAICRCLVRHAITLARRVREPSATLLPRCLLRDRRRPQLHSDLICEVDQGLSMWADADGTPTPSLVDLGSRGGLQARCCEINQVTSSRHPRSRTRASTPLASRARSTASGSRFEKILRERAGIAHGRSRIASGWMNFMPARKIRGGASTSSPTLRAGCVR